MNLWQSIILGLIQGFAEPIPVSSSAQTQIAAFLLGVSTPGILFEVFLNFASFLAILWITRKQVFSILKGCLMYINTQNEKNALDFKIAIYVLIGTFPAALLGFSMKEVIDNNLSQISTIGSFLIFTGFLLFFVRKMNGSKDYTQMTYKDALIIGLVQGTIALIPGVSRSGATIVAALLLGLNRETSFKYSFLLYLPIGLGTMIIGGKEFFSMQQVQSQLFEYIIMFVCALLSTIFGYSLFKSVMERGKLVYFSLYCWILGFSLIIFL